MIMNSVLGLALGLLSGFFEAVINTYINYKKKSIPPVLMGLAGFLLLFPLNISALFFIEVPKLSLSFIGILLFFCLINIIGRILYIKAIHLSGMAKTILFLSFTPLFLIVVAFFIVKELPSLFGSLGVFFIVVGAIILSKKKNISLISSLKQDKGTILMLITALIFSFSASIAKLMFNMVPALFVIVAIMIIQPFFFILAALKETNLKEIKTRFSKDLLFFLITGFLFALTEISVFIGLSLAKVAYVNSMKRINILFSTIFGYLFFKEPGFRKNMFATILMMIGVIIISIYG